MVQACPNIWSPVGLLKSIVIIMLPPDLGCLAFHLSILWPENDVCTLQTHPALVQADITAGVMKKHPIILRPPKRCMDIRSRATGFQIASARGEMGLS